MKITDIIFGNLLLEYRETKVQGILNNKPKMDKLASAVQKDSSADRFITLLPPDRAEEELVHPAEPVLRKLAEFDPTDKSLYINWLVDRYGQGDFRLEDETRVQNALNAFHKYKNRLDKSDIGDYPRLSAVAQAVRPLVQADEDPSERQKRLRTKRGELRKGNVKEIKVIMNTPNFVVEQPLTQAAMNNICNREGHEATWCTITDHGGRFDHYNSMGDLYQITAYPGTNRVRKFLVHVEDGQFMDENDDPIEQDDIDFLSAIPEYTKFLNMLINKHYSKYLED